jgi:hypothetical protein
MSLGAELPASTPKTDEPYTMKTVTIATALIRSARLHRFQSEFMSRIKYLDISSAFVDGDWGDEAVALPGNIDDESVAVSSVAQRAAQCRNMDGKIGRLDKNTGPNASHQLLLTDKLTWSLKQNNQDLQSTASEGRGLLAFKQKKLRREQAKRPE